MNKTNLTFVSHSLADVADDTTLDDSVVNPSMVLDSEPKPAPAAAPKPSRKRRASTLDAPPAKRAAPEPAFADVPAFAAAIVPHSGPLPRPEPGPEPGPEPEADPDQDEMEDEEAEEAVPDAPAGTVHADGLAIELPPGFKARKHPPRTVNLQAFMVFKLALAGSQKGYYYIPASRSNGCRLNTECPTWDITTIATADCQRAQAFRQWLWRNQAWMELKGFVHGQGPRENRLYNTIPIALPPGFRINQQFFPPTKENNFLKTGLHTGPAPGFPNGFFLHPGERDNGDKHLSVPIRDLPIYIVSRMCGWYRHNDEPRDPALPVTHRSNSELGANGFRVPFALREYFSEALGACLTVGYKTYLMDDVRGHVMFFVDADVQASLNEANIIDDAHLHRLMDERKVEIERFYQEVLEPELYASIKSYFGAGRIKTDCVIQAGDVKLIWNEEKTKPIRVKWGWHIYFYLIESYAHEFFPLRDVAIARMKTRFDFLQADRFPNIVLDEAEWVDKAVWGSAHRKSRVNLRCAGTTKRSNPDLRGYSFHKMGGDGVLVNPADRTLRQQEQLVRLRTMRDGLVTGERRGHAKHDAVKFRRALQRLLVVCSLVARPDADYRRKLPEGGDPHNQDPEADMDDNPPEKKGLTKKEVANRVREFVCEMITREGAMIATIEMGKYIPKSSVVWTMNFCINKLGDNGRHGCAHGNNKATYKVRPL